MTKLRSKRSSLHAIASSISWSVIPSKVTDVAPVNSPSLCFTTPAIAPFAYMFSDHCVKHSPSGTDVPVKRNMQVWRTRLANLPNFGYIFFWTEILDFFFFWISSSFAAAVLLHCETKDHFFFEKPDHFCSGVTLTPKIIVKPKIGPGEQCQPKATWILCGPRHMWRVAFHTTSTFSPQKKNSTVFPFSLSKKYSFFLSL